MFGKGGDQGRSEGVDGAWVQGLAWNNAGTAAATGLTMSNCLRPAFHTERVCPALPCPHP